FWFQLYVMRDRGFAASLIERAKAAKCSALVLTLDLQVQGQRHQDLKNGLAVPPRLTLGTFLDVLGKPSWALNVLRGKRKSFGNLEGRIPNTGSLTTLSQWIAGQFDPTLSWKDVEWVKNLWGGKLILKGILDAEDAKIAASIGARGALIGRAFLYGLGAMGEKGVTSVLEIIRSELDVTMALCGLRDVKDASPAILRR